MTDVLSGAMWRQIAHWQVQRLNAERSSASRNHFNSLYLEQSSTEQSGTQTIIPHHCI
jgi:hypothetical protein